MAANGGIPATGVGSLFTLIKRLEAATSRLEDIAVAQGSGSSPEVLAEAGLANAPASSTSPSASAPPPATADSTLAAAATTPSIKAYDELLSGPLAAFLSAASKVGASAAEQAAVVDEAFRAQRTFLVLAGRCRKPASQEALMELLGPTSAPLNRTVEVKERNRADRRLFNGLSAVAEGIPALAWVTVDSKPGPLVAESKDSAQFWANRVLKEFKDSEPAIVEWSRSFITVLEELRKYIMQFHTTCLSWNPKGEDPATWASKASSAAAPAAPAAGAPPPPPPPPGPPAPPPPPPPAGAAASASAPAAAAGGMDAVFASINQGEGITSSLRRVDKSEMTHKNPSLRTSSHAAPEKRTPPSPSSGSPTLGGAAKRPMKPPKPQSFQRKPAKKQLDGNKWAVEYFENDTSVVVAETEINQIVNIFGCKNSTIQIKGKVNAVTLVSCTKTSVLLDSTVASLSITSSPSFTVQILGKVPTIMIDATDGGQVYLSKESLGVEIVTAKTSALNVSLPVDGEEEGIFEEKAVPEQLKTVVQNGKLVTTVLEHTG